MVYPMTSCMRKTRLGPDIITVPDIMQTPCISGWSQEYNLFLGQLLKILVKKKFLVGRTLALCMIIYFALKEL